MTAPAKAKRGFAAMDPEEARRIASLGGKAVPSELRSFLLNRALAIAAGRKGGKVSRGGGRKKVV